MNLSHVDVALNEASKNLDASILALIDHCALSKIVLTFLTSLRQNAGWITKIGLSLAIGATNEWRSFKGCVD